MKYFVKAHIYLFQKLGEKEFLIYLNQRYFCLMEMDFIDYLKCAKIIYNFIVIEQTSSIVKHISFQQTFSNKQSLFFIHQIIDL